MAGVRKLPGILDTGVGDNIMNPMPMWAALAFALLIASAQAETSALGPGCTGREGVAWEQQIKDCTAIINAKELTEANRALAYRNRGIAHLELTYGASADQRRRENSERAIADLSMAIKL